MGKVYRFLGLSCAAVHADMGPAEARAAFAADVTYVTGQELGFTYLKDNTAQAVDEARGARSWGGVFLVVVGGLEGGFWGSGVVVVLSGEQRNDPAQKPQTLITYLLPSHTPTLHPRNPRKPRPETPQTAAAAATHRWRCPSGCASPSSTRRIPF